MTNINVRKAETLKSIDELNLSKATTNCLKRRDLVDPEAAVKAGREFSIDFMAHPDLAKDAPKWQQELVSKLDKAGFIRHDLDLRTYRFWRFYKAIFDVKIKEIVEMYEDMPPITDLKVMKVMDVLDTLTEKEQWILKMHFGLGGEGPKDLETVGMAYYVTRERVRQIEAKALRKLRHPSRLRSLPELYGFVPPEKIPTGICLKTTDGRKVVDPDTTIDNLCLSARTYTCLRRSKISTVRDMVNLPAEDWFKVRNLGRKGLEEVIEKMHEAGYPEFRVV